jgi:hypothetical protein
MGRNLWVSVGIVILGLTPIALLTLALMLVLD